MSSSEDDLDEQEIPEYRIVFGVGAEGIEGVDITPSGSRDQSPETNAQ